MKPYKMFVASTGVLLTSALALASLAACGGAEPAPERDRDRSVELPAGEPQPLDECQPGEEYTSGGVLCGDGNWEVEVPIDDPPMCEQLPGGCFPDDEDPYPWEPPPPPDTGGGGDPPPPPPPGDGLDCGSVPVNCRKIAKVDCSGETPTNQRGCSNSEISDLQAACRALCGSHGSGSDGVHYCHADSSQSGTGENPHVYVYGNCDCSDGSVRAQGVFRYCQ